MRKSSDVTSKNKLRTASDIISRLRWDASQVIESSAILIGYMDRIEGPMEKAVKDFISASTGGDIPEHRILYFRRSTGNSQHNRHVLWDRVGRVDRIFGSGNGPDAPVASETIQRIQEAKQNMQRIEEEKEERRKQKAKLRSRRSAKQHLTMKSNTNNVDNSTKETRRFHWQPVKPYSFTTINSIGDGAISPQTKDKRSDSTCGIANDITIVTWNVLFDIFDNGVDVDKEDYIKGRNSSTSTWQKLCSILKCSNADVISLQEVTPSFFKILFAQQWVRESYVCSACPENYETVNPYGVLLLWRRSKFRASTVLSCIDTGRHRCIIAGLQPQETNELFLCAAAHLPADRVVPTQSVKSNERTCRRLARKRELSAILGQFQRMVDKCDQQDVAVTPIIAGDFNCEDDELFDGYFADSTGGPSTTLFTDIWVNAGSPSHGFTFDTVTNPRAERSSRLVHGKRFPRRIDRIFVGPTYRKGRMTQAGNLKPTDVGILGSFVAPELPPSDHFGVKAILRRSKAEDLEPLCSISIPTTMWSANSPPSRHCLLALILDNPAVESLKKSHNETSTLSRPHITLLHGFVEATFGCLDLAMTTIQEALYATNDQIDPPTEITFHGDQAMELFQHRNSCSLVAVPDQTSPAYHWLCLFYTKLRQRFLSCVDQEGHSKSGWNPHVTLAAVGSSVQAAELQALWNENGSWQPGHTTQMATISVDILTRSDEGTFHSALSIPCQSKPKIADTVNSLLSDNEISLAQSTETESSFMLLLLKRICRKVGEKMHVHTSLHLSGSACLGAAIPGMSDIDMVLKVEGHAGSQISLTKEASLMETFFQQMIHELTNEYDDLRIRLRQASGNTILTLRLPSHPSVDIALCICDGEGMPVNSSSQVALDSLMTGQTILRSLHNAGGLVLEKAYKQALRIVKVWAMHKDIYGSSTGFLGGGGYAVWLANACLLFWEQQGQYVKANMSRPNDGLVEKLVRYFFNSVTSVPVESFCLGIELRSEHGQENESTSTIHHRRHRPGTLSIRAPCDSTGGSDFGRSTTRSTAQRIVTEMRNASSFLSSRNSGGDLRRSLLELLKQPCSLENFLSQFPYVILMTVSCANPDSTSLTFTKPQHLHNNLAKPAEWKAWGNTQFLNIVVSLETDGASTIHSFDPSQMMHPKSKPVTRRTSLKHGGSSVTFTWIVGISLSEHHGNDEELFLRRLRVWLEDYNRQQLQPRVPTLDSSGSGTSNVQLNLFSSDDAKLEFSN